MVLRRPWRNTETGQIVIDESPPPACSGSLLPVKERVFGTGGDGRGHAARLRMGCSPRGRDARCRRGGDRPECLRPDGLASERGETGASAARVGRLARILGGRAVGMLEGPDPREPRLHSLTIRL